MVLNNEEVQVTSLHDSRVKVSLAEFVRQVSLDRRVPVEVAFQEVVEAGASRVGQLQRYKDKRRDAGSRFRPYAPAKLSAAERGKVKRAAAAEGVVPDGDRFPWRCQFRDESGRRCLAPASAVEHGHEFH